MANYPVRVIWHTNPFADFGHGLAEDGVSGRSNDILLGGSSLGNGEYFIQAVFRDPRIDRHLVWGDAYTLKDAGYSTALDESYGIIPSDQNHYEITFRWSSAIAADAFYCVGIENANITLSYSNNGNAFTNISLDSEWDNNLRQDRHWSGLLAQKFATFPEVSATYFRVRFSRVAGLPFYGFMSNIYFARHYTYEASLSGGHRIRYFGDGPAQGGNFSSDFRDAPVFRSGLFNFRIGTLQDVQDMRRMFWRRAQGDPVIVQYYPNRDQDANTLYGVLAATASEEPLTNDTQISIDFTVNELTRNRDATQVGGPGSDWYIYD